MKFATVQRPSRRNHVSPFEAIVNEFFNNDLPKAIAKPVLKSNPAVNVFETDDNFVIEMAVPGLTKKDININIEDDKLTISAKQEADETKEGTTFLRREFSKYDFSRTFNLTDSIDQDSVKAIFKNGILTLTLAKKEEAKPQPARQIEIA